MTYSEAIIKRLTQLCMEKNITVNKLATLSGITQSTLNSIMNGETKNPKLKTLRKIAMGLNMTVPELLDFMEILGKKKAEKAIRKELFAIMLECRCYISFQH